VSVPNEAYSGRMSPTSTSSSRSCRARRRRAREPYQDYIAEPEHVPAIPDALLPGQAAGRGERPAGVEPLDPYPMLTPEHWYYVRETARSASTMAATSETTGVA
jgi:hypothetical protein